MKRERMKVIYENSCMLQDTTQNLKPEFTVSKDSSMLQARLLQGCLTVEPLLGRDGRARG